MYDIKFNYFTWLSKILYDLTPVKLCLYFSPRSIASYFSTIWNFSSLAARHSLASESFPLPRTFFISPLHLCGLLQNHRCLWKAPAPIPLPSPGEVLQVLQEDMFSITLLTHPVFPGLLTGRAESAENVLKEFVIECISK